MPSFIDPKPEAFALAGGAVAISLMDLLVKRNVISAADALGVCRRAQDELKRLVGMNGADASAYIDDVIGRLPQ